MEETKLWSLLTGCVEFSDLRSYLFFGVGINKNPDFHYRPIGQGPSSRGKQVYNYCGKTYQTRKELIMEHALHGLTYKQVERRITVKGWTLEQALTTPLRK